jgi:hypothetical protein
MKERRNEKMQLTIPRNSREEDKMKMENGMIINEHNHRNQEAIAAVVT